MKVWESNDEDDERNDGDEDVTEKRGWGWDRVEW